ncbi:PKD domain-containing protein, partial [Oscillatoria amoena NRMC-F 0135]|nr:PKD domain-containing protein [Oscillatoria amoena NRMC-F 0135]
QSGNEFRIFSYDSLGSFDTRLGSLITTNTTGKILVTILDQNVKAYSLRIWSSKPEIFGEFSDTLSVKNRSDVSFQVANYFGGDTAQCLKGNRFFFNVKLTDTSQVKSHVWDFGDGDSSLLWIPNKAYAAADTYDIKLKTFSPSYGCSTVTTKRVYVWPTPKAAFTADKTSVCEKDTIRYTNNSSSSGENLYYTWQLPTSAYTSGTSSTSKDVVQSYFSERLFTPRLYTKNIYNCSDTAVGTGFTVSKPPSAYFSINFLKPCINGNSVALNNQTAITTTFPKKLTYSWDFGDGTISTDEFPTKVYGSVGQKKIQLKATNNGICSDSINKTVIILPNPVAGFTINNDTQCLNGNQFVFTNSSSLPGGGATTNSWLVGSATSSAINPTFTLNNAGTYTARLTVRASTGCSDSIENNILVHPSPNQTISGPITSKGKKQDVYSVVQNAGSVYQWQVSGGSIVGATNTNQVTVKWDENAGSIGQVFLIETNAVGCVGNPSVKIVNLEPSSISGIENIYNINLYPNPANNQVGINIGSYDKHYSTTIFNGLGEEVFSVKETMGNSLLPLDNFANGIYFVYIEGENFSFKQKLVIQKQ